MWLLASDWATWASGILGGVLGGLLVFFATLWRKLLARLRLTRLLGLQADAVSLIVSTRDEARVSRQGMTQDKWTASYGTLRAVEVCSSQLTELGKTAIHVGMSAGPDTNALQDDLILLGGNDENSFSCRAIRFLKFNYPLIKFDYDDSAREANIVSLGNTGRLHYDWEAEKERGFTSDYGILAWWINPFAQQQRRLLFFAGFTSSGTRAISKFALTQYRGALLDSYLTKRGVAPGKHRRWLWLVLRQRSWPCFIALYRLRRDSSGTEFEVAGAPLAFELLKVDDAKHLRDPEHIKLDTRDDGTLDASERSTITLLLEEAFGHKAVRDRDQAWTQLPPFRRVLAFAAEHPSPKTSSTGQYALVGQISTVKLTSTGPLTVVGFSDLAVSEKYRGLGIGRQLLERAIHDAESEADIVMIASSAGPVIHVIEEHRFAKTKQGMFFYDTTDGHRSNSDWWYRSKGSQPPSEIRIVGDF